MARSTPLPGSSRFLPLIAFVLSIAALYFAREVLIPFALAVLFSFMLTPVVKGLAGTWAADLQYAVKLAAVANEIRAHGS